MLAVVLSGDTEKKTSICLQEARYLGGKGAGSRMVREMGEGSCAFCGVWSVASFVILDFFLRRLVEVAFNGQKPGPSMGGRPPHRPAPAGSPGRPLHPHSERHQPNRCCRGPGKHRVIQGTHPNPRNRGDQFQRAILKFTGQQCIHGQAVREKVFFP